MTGARVDRGAAQPQLKVQVRASRAAGRSHLAEAAPPPPTHWPRRTEIRDRCAYQLVMPASAGGRRACRSRRCRGAATRRSRPRRRAAGRPRARPGRARGGTCCRAGRGVADRVGDRAQEVQRRGAGGRRSAESVPAPATPSAERPAHAWKRRSAASVRAPRPPSNVPEGKPLRGEQELQAGDIPAARVERSGRLPSRGRPRRPSARRVRGPTTPSAGRPRRRWSRWTAATVAGPGDAVDGRPRRNRGRAARPAGRRRQPRLAEAAAGAATATRADDQQAGHT